MRSTSVLGASQSAFSAAWASGPWQGCSKSLLAWDRMSERPERETYPFWVAMGAAFVGTLLGGGAVWIGVSQRLQAIEEPGSAVAIPSDSVDVEPSRVDPDPPREAPVVQAGAGDPGDSPLVRAVEQTRDAVVTLAVGGAVRGAGVVYDPS